LRSPFRASFLGLLDALGDAGIKVVAARHEGAAAFMAEASAQLTGRPAAVMGTRAVGAANMAIGIHTARQDSSPVFFVVGQVQRSRRGREAFQEVDQVETFGRLAKWAVEVERVSALREAMDESIRRALSGRPGPVLLSLPEDLLDEPMTDARHRSRAKYGIAAMLMSALGAPPLRSRATGDHRRRGRAPRQATSASSGSPRYSSPSDGVAPPRRIPERSSSTSGMVATAPPTVRGASSTPTPSS
jgi:hypothetical protein